MMQIFFNTALFCISEVFQPFPYSDFNGTSQTLFSARSEGPSPALAGTTHEHHPGRAAAGRAGPWQTQACWTSDNRMMNLGPKNTQKHPQLTCAPTKACSAPNSLWFSYTRGVAMGTQSWFHQIIFHTILSLTRVTQQRWMHMESSTAIRWCIQIYTTAFSDTTFEKPRNFLEAVNPHCFF